MRNTLETRLGTFFAFTLIVAVIILEMVGVADFFKPGYKVEKLFTVPKPVLGSWVNLTADNKGRLIASDQDGFSPQRLNLSD